MKKKLYILWKHKNADKSWDDFVVFPVQDNLPYGCLPTGKEVLGYLFWTHEIPGSNLHHDAAFIMNHCIACNIYTATHKSARENLEKMTATHTTLKKHTAKKKSETF